MAAGRADTYDQRHAILGGIVMRNRMVSMLRVIVPALGVVVFLALAAQIYVAGLARQYGVAGIRIDRGTVVVEAPQYAGTGSNGDRYLATAREARSPLGASHEIDMIEATLELSQSDGTVYLATSRTALLDTNKETVTAPGIVDVTGSDGMVGKLTDVEAETRAEIVTSTGPVDLLLSDGTTILGSTMVYDGKKQTWTFTQVTVTVPQLPEAEEAVVPGPVTTPSFDAPPAGLPLRESVQ